MKGETRIGYMDDVDFQYHLGEDINGAKVYPSADDVRESGACSDPAKTSAHCGIVKVRVEVLEVVQPNRMFEDDEPLELRDEAG